MVLNAISMLCLYLYEFLYGESNTRRAGNASMDDTAGAQERTSQVTDLLFRPKLVFQNQHTMLEASNFPITQTTSDRETDCKCLISVLYPFSRAHCLALQVSASCADQRLDVAEMRSGQLTNGSPTTA